MIQYIHIGFLCLRAPGSKRNATTSSRRVILQICNDALPLLHRARRVRLIGSLGCSGADERLELSAELRLEQSARAIVVRREYLGAQWVRGRIRGHGRIKCLGGGEARRCVYVCESAGWGGEQRGCRGGPKNRAFHTRVQLPCGTCKMCGRSWARKQLQSALKPSGRPCAPCAISASACTQRRSVHPSLSSSAARITVGAQSLSSLSAASRWLHRCASGGWRSSASGGASGSARALTASPRAARPSAVAESVAAPVAASGPAAIACRH